MDQAKLARVVSQLTTPFFLLAASILAVSINGSLEDLAKAGIFLLITGVPIIVAYALEYWQDERTTADPGRDDRDVMYLTGVFSSVVAATFFGLNIMTDVYWMNVGMVMAVYFGAYYLINRYFDKASFHAGTLGFVALFLAGQINWGWSLLLILFPVVAWGRITLHKHTWVELLWGWSIGLTVGLVSWYIQTGV